MRESREGTGRIIDSEEQVGGYPVVAPNRRQFDLEAWDLRTMEPKRPAETGR